MGLWTSAAGGLDRHVVVFLEENLDVKAVAGILERLQGTDHASDDLRLSVGRDEDGANRKVGVSQCPRQGIADPDHAWLRQRPLDQVDAVDKSQHI